MPVERARDQPSVRCPQCGGTVPVPLGGDPDSLQTFPPRAPALPGANELGFWVFAVAIIAGAIGAKASLREEDFREVPLILPWFMVLALAIWVGRLTVLSCMLWVALTAVYLAGMLAALRGGSVAGGIAFGSVFWGSLIGLFVAAGRRFEPGRARKAARVAFVRRALAAIIGVSILTAMCLPAVRCTLEGARRAQCRWQLHEIGLALKNYHGHYGCFPPAVLTDGHGRPMHNWIVCLLPYLDERALYEAYNFRHAHDAPANSTVTGQRLDALICPSTGGDKPVTHYRMVVCDGSAGGVDRYPTQAEIVDGPANTIIVIEAAHSPCRWASPDAVVNPVRRMNLPRDWPPCASSDHQHGVYALFADGDERFLSDKTETKILRALCTMAGGEEVDGDGF